MAKGLIKLSRKQLPGQPGWLKPAVMVLFLLLWVIPGRADWLGEMQSGNQIDHPEWDSQEMALQFDDANDGVAVVTQKDTTFYNLWPTSQTYGANGPNSWTVDSSLINNTTLFGVGDVSDPQMSLTDSGNGLCVYAQYSTSTTRYRIYGVQYSKNQNLGTFAPINNSWPIDSDPNSLTGNTAGQPTVVQVTDNFALITYLQNDGAYNHIFASRWANNAWSYWTPQGWATTGSGLAIDGSDAAANASRPHLAESTTGDVYCVYAKEGTSHKAIYASMYRNGQWYYWGIGGNGGWVVVSLGGGGTSVPISIDDTNLDADRPKLTALPNGQMLCVYEVTNKSDNSRQILYTLFDGQTWVPGDASARVDGLAATVNASAPCVASSLPTNKVICVFAKGDAGTPEGQHVYASEWTGGAWEMMNQGNALDSRGNTVTPITPKIAFDHHGNAIALYQQWFGVRTNVVANYFQGPPFVATIAPDSSNNNTTVTVTINGYNYAGGSTPATKVSARLQKAGRADIVGTNVQVATPTNNFFTAQSFTVDFDVNGAQVGDWDLMVENPDNQSYLSPSIFGITWPDLKQAYPYPNPIKLNGTGPQAASNIRFFNLVRTVTIRIYTLKGELVRTLNKDDRRLFIDWDMRNEAGGLVAPGVYLYRIDAAENDSVQTGKVMVIR